MRNFKRILFLMIVCLVLISTAFVFVACSSGSADYKNGAYDELGDSKSSSTKSIIVTTTDRMLVYYVDISINVKDLEKTKQELTDKTKEFGGYQQESYADNDGYFRCVYRIPTENLDAFVESVKGEGSINNLTIRTDDITELYTNAIAEKTTLQARKAALEAMLQREDLTLEDEITISSRLADVDAQLNKYTKEAESYKKQSDFSTVTVYVYHEGEYKEPSFWDNLGEVFIGSASSIGKVCGWLITAFIAIIPYALVIGGIFGLYVLIKFIVCKKKKIPFTLFKKARERCAYRKQTREYYRTKNAANFQQRKHVPPKPTQTTQENQIEKVQSDESENTDNTDNR